jgi:L-asparaginase II
MDDPTAPLVRIERGGLPESLHRGALAVADAKGVRFAMGDPSWVVFPRSALKPFQALAGVVSGAVDALEVPDDELAVATGSHDATAAHVAAVRSLLARAGVAASLLRCGGHLSIDPDEAFRQRQGGERPPATWSNCSGKHALMLVVARRLGADLASYAEPDHPVQRMNRRHLARFAGLAEEDVRHGVDGCGAPAFAVPIGALALALARLGRPDGLPPDLAGAAARVVKAMRAHPAMVAGAKRFDTDLMLSAAEPLVAKGGAEGVHGVALPERGLGIAVKAEDGRDRGYRLVVIDLLERLGALSAEAARGLRERQTEAVVKSMAGAVVGRSVSLLPGRLPL